MWIIQCNKLSRRIGILRKIRSILPLRQPVMTLYYNSMIEPLFDYVNVIWTTCDKENLYRVLKMQKLRVLHVLSSSLTHGPLLFQSLVDSSGSHFMKMPKNRLLTVAYKRALGRLPSYVNELLRLNNNVLSRKTQVL